MSDAATETKAVTPPTSRPGAIMLVRHGEPAASRRVRFHAAEYDRWWLETYEPGGLRPGQTPPAELLRAAADAGAIFASTRRRSIETAQSLAAGRDFTADAVFIEAPLPPPAWPAWLKLRPRTWGVIARFWWWFFDHHQGQETRAQAEVRATEAADRLEAAAVGGREVLLVAHGFFNAMIGRELVRRGWRLALDQGYQYWSARRFEKA